MRESPVSSLRRYDALVLLPLVMAVVLRAVGELFPSDEVWGHMAHSIGLSAWPWLCLFAPAWALLARWRVGHWRWPMWLAVSVLPLAGLPFAPDSGEGELVLVANVNAYRLVARTLRRRWRPLAHGWSSGGGEGAPDSWPRS